MDCSSNPIVRNLNTNASVFAIAKQRDCIYSRETHRHMKHWEREGEHKHPSGMPQSLVAVAGLIRCEIASQTEGWSSEKYKKAD